MKPKPRMSSYVSIWRCSLVKFALLTCYFVSICFADTDLHSSVSTDNKNNVQPLPIFYFHGINGNPGSGANYAANLTAEGRLVTALSFCSDLCSIGALDNQVKLAIAQIRGIVANNTRYEDGYVFIGYSQGGLIARTVIEEMDDHKVKAFISLAGAQNGLFDGPQPSDYVPLLVFVRYFGPLLIPPTLFNFTQYSEKDYHGKLQRDFEEVTLKNPALQQQLSSINMGRSPFFNEWIKSNPFLPKYNNVNACAGGLLDLKCALEKKRRRRNFLKLQALHLFASPGDDVISPWQASLMAQYSNVNSLDEIETKFASLKIVNMENTLEYQDDTYGLKTLDKRGKLFLHTIPGICHTCWMSDSYPVAGGSLCEFKPLYDKYIFPVLKDPLCFGRAKLAEDF
ncbi:Lysosomal thioesterase ppt2 [Globisporangium polare]